MDEIVGTSLLGSVDDDIYGDAQLVPGKRNKALYTNGLDQCGDLGNQRSNCMGNLSKCDNGFVMAMWLQMHPYDTLPKYYITSGGHTSRSIGVALLMQGKQLKQVVAHHHGIGHWHIPLSLSQILGTTWSWHGLLQRGQIFTSMALLVQRTSRALALEVTDMVILTLSLYLERTALVHPDIVGRWQSTNWGSGMPTWMSRISGFYMLRIWWTNLR